MPPPLGTPLHDNKYTPYIIHSTNIFMSCTGFFLGKMELTLLRDYEQPVLFKFMGVTPALLYI